jgi:hypothetical protein
VPTRTARHAAQRSARGSGTGAGLAPAGLDASAQLGDIGILPLDPLDQRIARAQQLEPDVAIGPRLAGGQGDHHAGREGRGHGERRRLLGKCPGQQESQKTRM